MYIIMKLLESERYCLIGKREIYAMEIYIADNYCFA